MPTKKTIPVLTARYGPDKAIGESLVNKEKPWYTRCKIKLQFGPYSCELPESYYWNGANIPPVMHPILGVDQYDPRVALASGFHDDGCERDDVPQAMADAVFVALLGKIEFNGIELDGIGHFQAMCCYIGVRFYSLIVRPTTRLFFRRES